MHCKKDDHLIDNRTRKKEMGVFRSAKGRCAGGAVWKKDMYVIRKGSICETLEECL